MLCRHVSFAVNVNLLLQCIGWCLHSLLARVRYASEHGLSAAEKKVLFGDFFDT